MLEPGALVAELEQKTSLPAGDDERFTGYGVMALPFLSGHLLAMRRFPATSIGPGYRSVWHRDPQGRWTFYSDVSPGLACPRYFGSAIADARSEEIRIDWPGQRDMHMSVGHGILDWRMSMAPSAVTTLFSAAGSVLPEPLWRNRAFLRFMGVAAGYALQAGRVGLQGQVPNGQWFVANPRLIWTIPVGQAVLNGIDLGPLGPLPEQARLGDFWLPQRGLFAIGRAFFEPYQPSRHVATTCLVDEHGTPRFAG